MRIAKFIDDLDVYELQCNELQYWGDIEEISKYVSRVHRLDEKYENLFQQLFSVDTINNISFNVVLILCTDYRRPCKESTSLMKRRRHLATKYHNIQRGRRSMIKWFRLRNFSMLHMTILKRIVCG